MARQSHMAQSARGITKWKISPISQCRGEEKRLKESAGEEGGAAIIRLLLRDSLQRARFGHESVSHHHFLQSYSE